MSERITKVNELILQQLGEIINKNIELPIGTLATITEVNVSSDLCYAQVKMSVFPEDQADYIIHKMNLLAKRLQNILAKKIVLHNFPKLKFLLDDSQNQAENIEKLLDKIKEEIKG